MLYVEELCQNKQDEKVLRALPRRSRPYYAAQRRVDMTTPSEVSLLLYKVFKIVLLIYCIVQTGTYLCIGFDILRQSDIAKLTFEEYLNIGIAFGMGLASPICCGLIYLDISKDIFSAYTGAIRRWVVLFLLTGDWDITHNGVTYPTVHLLILTILLFVSVLAVCVSRKDEHIAFWNKDRQCIRMVYKEYVAEECSLLNLYSRLG